MAKRGRPPGGEFPGKSATFTTRIQPETRRALEEAAKARHRGSISAAAEFLLKSALTNPSGLPRNQALACAIGILAESIERDTKKDWRTDTFTGTALRHAVEALLFHFAPMPENTPPIPPAIQEAADKMPPMFAEQFRKPAGFGHVLAYNLILEIEQAAPPTILNEWSLPIFFSKRPAQLGLINSALGLADSKKGKRK
jgi:hypothetical protein